MKTLLSSLLIVCMSFQLSFQNQDLCGAAREAGLIFANDPSDCKRYLYCDEAEDITFQMKCWDPAYPNFYLDACYPEGVWATQDGVECITTAPADPPEEGKVAYCPNLEDASITFGDNDDALCQKHSFCLTGAEEKQCTGSLVFNRNYGTCDLQEFAPCGIANDPPGGGNPCTCVDLNDVDVACSDCDWAGGATVCDPDAITFVQFPASCSKYKTCQKGDVLREYECRSGLHFNPNGNVCDRPENLNPPCEYARSVRLNLQGKKIPTAPSKSMNNNPLLGALRFNLLTGRKI